MEKYEIIFHTSLGYECPNLCFRNLRQVPKTLDFRPCPMIPFLKSNVRYAKLLLFEPLNDIFDLKKAIILGKESLFN